GILFANLDQVQLFALNIQYSGIVSSATSHFSFVSLSLVFSGFLCCADEFVVFDEYCFSYCG
ncbi:hypothetical protein, partial [Acinetobacter baumannii]